MNDLYDRFERDIRTNPYNAEILARWNDLRLPDGWLVAGCLFQTVWNVLRGLLPAANIRDYDLFYYDAANLTEDGERAVQARVDRALADLPIEIEATNQARVHLWYEAYFGFPSPTLRSSRDGINRFLVAETCVGVHPAEDALTIYAPHGLRGIYDGTLSPNPATPDEGRFTAKALSYQRRWPSLHLRCNKERPDP